MSTLNKAALTIASGAAALIGSSMMSATVNAAELPSTSAPSQSQSTQLEQGGAHTGGSDGAAAAQKKAEQMEAEQSGQAQRTQPPAVQQPATQTAPPATESRTPETVQEAPKVPAKETEQAGAASTTAPAATSTTADEQKATLDAAKAEVRTRKADKKNAQESLDTVSSDAARTKAVLDAAQTHADASSAALATAQQKVSHAQEQSAKADKAVATAQADVTAKSDAKREAERAATTADANLSQAQQEAASKATSTVNTADVGTSKSPDSAVAGADVPTVDFFNQIGTAATILTDPSYQPWLVQHPEWQKLGELNDATTMANMLASVEGLRKLNELRASLGLGELKVSAWLTADAQSHADYSGGEYWELSKYSHANQDYPNLPFNSSENSAVNSNWDNAYKAWYDNEKVIWDAAVAKDPSLAATLTDPNGAYNLFKSNKDLYEQVGHYLNIVDPTLKVMGMAQSYNPQERQFSYSQDMAPYSTNDGKLYTVDEWESLVRSSIDASANAEAPTTPEDTRVTDAQLVQSAAQAQLAAASASLSTAQTTLDTAVSTAAQAHRRLDSAEAELRDLQTDTATAVTALAAAVANNRQAQRTLVDATVVLAKATAAVKTAEENLAAIAAARVPEPGNPTDTDAAGGTGNGGTGNSRIAVKSGTAKKYRTSERAKAELYAAIHAATDRSIPPAPPIDHTDFAVAADGSLSSMPQTGADVTAIVAMMVSATLTGAGALELKRLGAAAKK